MSVRNILDGTIKVGSGEVMPVEPEIPEELELKKLTVDGGITTGGLAAEEVNCERVLTNSTTVKNSATVGTLTVNNKATVGSLTVDSREVLGMQTTNAKMTITGLKADGKTPVSFEITTNRWLYNIYPGLHNFVMVFNLTTEPLSQLTIPTGLTSTSIWWGKTLLKTDNDQFLDCVMQLSAIDGKLVIKIDIPTASSYAGLQGKLTIPFF